MHFHPREHYTILPAQPANTSAVNKQQAYVFRVQKSNHSPFMVVGGPNKQPELQLQRLEVPKFTKHVVLKQIFY